ncbi:Ig-like domain-containing protein [Algoriphagus halophilus]|uniref:Por secretion system C-terminal sorting domain-containing protein n=1 Tax=Algoriphagus halophilus TaxID=226505 RepID=A0A1N6EBJ5_9BACT|nr:Ig-like domain-containing protein [Algoriphagus halophilus]SIN80399.1 Por secretion system C-terminal sorting domain-containing protein [Algoriphagus halophilus]
MRKITFTPTFLFQKSILLKLLILVTLFYSQLQIGYATDYYFSTSSGNDGRSATQAQSPSTPWKTIDKLNSISSSLKSGDRILFRSGEVFYGTIKVASSGGSGSPIVFTSYGSGAKPIITSMVTISNFTSIGNGLYQADLSNYNLPRIQVVLLNNQIKEIGRYPNSDASNGGYLKIGSVQSQTGFTSTTGIPYNGSGGEVVVRKNNWIIDRHRINYISGNFISFQGNESHYAPQAGFGYFLQNHPSLLDRAGEWAYDPDSKKFTINLSGYNVSNVNIAVSSLENLVTHNPYINDLKFSNLHFKGSNGSIFEISRSQNFTVENSTLEFAGENAINAADVRGLVIQNNQILSPFNNGINIRYGAPGAIVSNNVIDKAMLFQGMAKSSDLAGIGIFVASDSDNSIVQKNRITNIGFNAIHFGGNYTKIVNNYIDNFCLFKQDGGGVYNNSDGLVGRNNIGREISGNIILNGKGTKNGTIEEVDMAEGIYLDDNSAGIKIANNTIAFMTGKGIYLHNANNIEVLNNLFYRSKVQLQLTHDYYGDPNRNIRISGNQYSNVDELEEIYSAYSVIDDIGSVGTINSNYFLDPFNQDFFIHTRSTSDPAVGINRNLGNWASSFGYDTNSTKPSFDLSTTKVLSSSLIKQSNFNAGSGIISGLYNASSRVLSSGISGNTLVIYPNSSSSATAYIQIGAVNSGEKILMEFDMKGSPENKPVELFLEATFNVDKGKGNKIIATKSGTTHYKVFLDAKATKSTESMVMRIPSSAQEVYLDNIEISKVQTEELPKENFVFFDYNASSSPVSVPLDGTYKNGKNQQFSGSVTIPAYGSVVLAKISNEGGSPENQLPTVTLTSPTQNQEFILGVNTVQLAANASDPEGQIKSVEFYNWGNLVTTVTSPPYVFNWTNAEIGNYQVYAKVTDQANQTAVSQTINFTVKNQPDDGPGFNAQMVSPTNNSVYEKGVNPVVLKTNATSSGLAIQKVEYFNWGFPILTVTSAPFEYTWSTIEPDNYKVFAQITDQSGKVYTTNEVSFKVTSGSSAPPALPTVKMDTPFNGQTFTLGSDLVTLKALVSDPTQVKSLQFYNWGFPLIAANSYPYQFDWTRIEEGNYKVHAEMVDINGNLIKSDPVSFKVIAGSGDTTPTVTMAQPYNGQQFVIGRDLVSLKANTNIDAARVEFFNWGFPLITAPVSTKQFDWTRIEVGEYLVFVRITDKNGVTYDSEAVRFRVNSTSARTSDSENQLSISSNSTTEIQSSEDPTINEVKILDQSSIYGIKMGPNPTNDEVTLYFEDYPRDLDGEIKLIDTRGVELQSQKFSTNDGNVVFNVSSFPEGVYIIRVDFGNKGVQTKKLIKN